MGGGTCSYTPKYTIRRVQKCSYTPKYAIRRGKSARIPLNIHLTRKNKKTEKKRNGSVFKKTERIPIRFYSDVNGLPLCPSLGKTGPNRRLGGGFPEMYVHGNFFEISGISKKSSKISSKISEFRRNIRKIHHRYENRWCETHLGGGKMYNVQTQK